MSEEGNGETSFIRREENGQRSTFHPSTTHHNHHHYYAMASAMGSSRANHEHLLDDVVAPDDSYLNGIYWADLPLGQRVKWVNAKWNEETAREFKLVMASFRRDPLQPIRDYFSNYVVKGMGLFVEGYTLFSVGNLTAIFASAWPLCWKTHKVCSKNWTAAVGYLEIVGIIIGQIMVGIIGDWIGRRWGLVQDACIMLVGTVMLTAMWGTTLNGWVICYALSLLIYSIGVGGEYPMTSTRAMEGKFGRNSTTGDKLHRGRNVQLAFLMQGWGQLFNQGILLACLLAFHGGSKEPYSALSVQWTFRVSFAFIGIITLWMCYNRFYQMEYTDRTLRVIKRKEGVTGYDIKSLHWTLSHYGGRLIGTSVAWFANDFFFYGNKIFQSQFIAVISPKGSSVVSDWLWNMVNIGVGLAGYYLAAFFLDHKFVGRSRMQTVGFLADFILFIIPAALYNQLLHPGAPIKTFQFIYFFSSFWNQFGPNATTFLLAAEVFPAPIRATAHGISAASGKLGALAPAILYNYIGTRTKFWVVSWFGLLGVAVTILFVPDTTGLDLREQERYWLLVREGRAADYHGIAVHPRHLSLWETWVLKRHRAYNPVLDREVKKNELRKLYEATLSGKETGNNQDYEDDASFVSSNVTEYFERERASSRQEKVTPSESSSN